MPPCGKCCWDPDAAIARSWVKRIESYVPTVNSIGTNHKNNFKYRGWRKRWEEQLGPWLQHEVAPAQMLRRVIITRHYGDKKRKFDRRNFEGGCKPLLDTLKNFGAVYDDSELWTLDYYQQLKSLDGKDYVEVEIQELV